MLGASACAPLPSFSRGGGKNQAPSIARRSSSLHACSGLPAPANLPPALKVTFLPWPQAGYDRLGAASSSGYPSPERQGNETPRGNDTPRTGGEGSPLLKKVQRSTHSRQGGRATGEAALDSPRGAPASAG